MKTGIVVNNYDMSHKQRCQIRVYGMHTEQIDGEYLILDDDLPWVLPAPNMGGNSGNFSVPEVGSRVYVDGDDNYSLRYFGQVEVKSSVKKMMNEDADQCDEYKFIAFNETPNNPEEYMKIYYLPEKGLNIECNGHRVLLTKYDGVLIESNSGCSIELTPDADININAINNININCNRINLTQGSLDEKTVDRIVLGSRLQEIFNNHKHFCATSGGITTTQPIDKIKETDFSTKIKIGKNE